MHMHAANNAQPPPSVPLVRSWLLQMMPGNRALPPTLQTPTTAISRLHITAQHVADAGGSSGGGSTFDTVLAGGTVIDPESGLNAVRHVGLRGGKIVAISEAPLASAGGGAVTTIDCTGLIVAPGFVDLHSHWDEQ